MRAFIVISLCIASVADCRRKHLDIEEAEVIQRPGEPRGAAEGGGKAAARPGDNTVMQGALRVRATLNGGPIPQGVECSVIAYDLDSSVSKRGSGGCEATITIAPGLVDVEVTLSAMGGLHMQKRLKGERIGADPKELKVDVAWAIGRLRVSHQESAVVRSCNVAVKGTALSAPDTTTFTLPIGTYSVDFECGPIRTTVANLVVAQGKDTVAVFKVEPGVAPSQVQTVTPGVTPPPLITNEAVQGQWGVPGLPLLQPSAVPPQSNKTEDLTVQSSNGN